MPVDRDNKMKKRLAPFLKNKKYTLSFLLFLIVLVICNVAAGATIYLICTMDMSKANLENVSKLLKVKRLVLLSSVSFELGTIYFLTISLTQMKNIRKEYKKKNAQYDRIVDLLRRMRCAVCEYDVVNGRITTNNMFPEILGKEIKEDFFYRIEEYKQVHPEFDFDGLLRELYYAIENKVTTSFESIYCKDKYSYKMLAVTMMPVIEKEEEVVRVLGSFRENSDEHIQLKEKVSMFDQIPGGTYRYNLSYPMHLDYIGEKLCKMMGYTRTELKEIAGDQYFGLVNADERKKYRAYIKEAALSPGVRTCQYGLNCKNGEIITVLDTMETIQNDSGYMYGYSVVVDISEYARRQNVVRQELENKLEMVRINNSVSQMQPHFLYNALSSIRELILANPNYASDMLYDFTIYLRACIRTMQNGDLITMGQEMENIRAYVNIEKMRMGSRLNVIYRLQAEDFRVPPLSIQPLVENAIRHGIYKRGKQGGTVTLQTDTTEDGHRIIIEDDGVGFDYQKVRDEVEKGERESIGLDNVMFRLKKRQNAKVIIKSNINVGTRISIWIPKEAKKDERNNT